MADLLKLYAAAIEPILEAFTLDRQIELDSLHPALFRDLASRGRLVDRVYQEVLSGERTLGDFLDEVWRYRGSLVEALEGTKDRSM